MNPFKQAENLRPSRSTFDLSHEVKLTSAFGKLTPIFLQECIPGDNWKIFVEQFTRMEPLLTPIMHNVYASGHFFFVPYRLLDDNFPDFIFGGVDGNSPGSIASDAALPAWDVSVTDDLVLGSLWDYFGFPLYPTPDTGFTTPVLSYPRSAYNFIYNEYYRDQTLVLPVPLTNSAVLNRAWTKDYFTSALPFQQRGTAPAFPISGNLPLYNKDGVAIKNLQSYSGSLGVLLGGLTVPTGSSTVTSPANAFGSDLNVYDVNTANGTLIDSPYVSLTSGVSFDISDLRQAVQLQKWMERNARGGVRYTEGLRAHFDVSPTDERLQRPEYIGGYHVEISTSEVLQTSASVSGGSPQGNMAGHGILSAGDYIGDYFVKEFGLIMGIMSIVPKPSYEQGVHRSWLRQTRFDFPFYEFAFLSEQAITRGELFFTNTASDSIIFGYQGRFDELRVAHDRVTSDFRNSGGTEGDLSYWHLGRYFATPPALNQDFIEIQATKLNEVFADLSADSRPLLTTLGFGVHVTRPLPEIPAPGLMDHF